MWKKLDQVENPPARLDASDVCFYARDYASGRNFEYSEANNLIINFKKSVSTRGTAQWYYKERAIKRFAQELASLLGSTSAELFVAPIPPSKRRDDPAYDPRLDMVLEQVTHQCNNVTVTNTIVRTVSKTPAHQSGSYRPSVDEVYESLDWNESLPERAKLMVLVDDVITAGTSFKACQKLVYQNAPQINVIGVFWARTVWPEQEFICPVDSDLF
jgi:hypothetical protein